MTLITYTPYGINSHRLFVRGMRIPYTEEAAEEREEGTVRWGNWQMVLVISFVMLIAVTLTVFIIIGGGGEETARDRGTANERENK